MPLIAYKSKKLAASDNGSSGLVLPSGVTLSTVSLRTSVEVNLSKVMYVYISNSQGDLAPVEVILPSSLNSNVTASVIVDSSFSAIVTFNFISNIAGNFKGVTILKVGNDTLRVAISIIAYESIGTVSYPSIYDFGVCDATVPNLYFFKMMCNGLTFNKRLFTYTIEYEDSRDSNCFKSNLDALITTVDSVILPIVFDPKRSGNISAILTFYYAGIILPTTLSLSGTTTLETPAILVQYPPVPTQNPNDLLVTPVDMGIVSASYINNTSRLIIIKSVSVENNNLNEFQIINSTNYVNMQLAAGSTLAIPCRYTKLTVGVKQPIVRVTGQFL